MITKFPINFKEKMTSAVSKSIKSGAKKLPRHSVKAKKTVMATVTTVS